MVTSEHFRTSSIQGVLFTPDASQFSQTSILATVLGQYASVYDGRVEAWPIPDEAPAEFPRLVLQSKDGTFKLQASPGRIDSFWIAQEEDHGANPLTCIEVLEHYLRSTKPALQIGRLALVTKRFALEDNPAQTLIERFCNAESRARPFNNSQSFEIHNHKRYMLPSYGSQINSWVRCRTGVLNRQPQQNLISVEQDINTLKEDEVGVNFDADKVRDFFASARTETDAILRIYFPPEG